MAQKNKKSRFGNPAKAAADAAARGRLAAPSAQLRLERAMAALAPGFANHLEGAGRPDKSIDNSLIIVDDFFDVYRYLEPAADPTALVPYVVREVMAEAAYADPLASLGLRSGMREYVSYLARAKLWTGGAEDLAEVLAELGQNGLQDGAWNEAWEEGQDGYGLAPIYVPELTREQTLETVLASALWRNTTELLAWIGDGRQTLGSAAPPEAAVAMVHSGLDVFAAAARLTTPAEYAAARLALHWDLLDVAGLITLENNRVSVPTEVKDSLEEGDFIIRSMQELMGMLIFHSTVAGFDEDGQWESAQWLMQCCSQAPPAPEQLVEALADPDGAHPVLLTAALNAAHWEEEGLLTVGTSMVVPPSYRADVYDVLRDDFELTVEGPGAAALG